MKYRRLSADRDYVMGRGEADLLTDTPETVAQAVATRLRLLAGEWFLDLRDGTPYAPAVLGRHTAVSYDLAVRERILGTPGVRAIAAYESALDPESRRLTVAVTVDTIYGPAAIQEVL
ncbi:hypothetical protein [Telmatospirillum sp. J64-1]|uniref:hypothetical protein n=1 Tax=Telmatospirillum sp. J64-1 TaxID=2502183 RepID=UPI00115E98FA|nr:hypothetical protein [Telmatospirillum sp. J64-1]